MAIKKYFNKMKSELRKEAQRVAKYNQQVMTDLEADIRDLEASIDRAVAESRKVEAKLFKKPMTEFQVRYDPKEGMWAEPVSFRVGLVEGAIGVIEDLDYDTEESFAPESYEDEHCRITPLSLVPTEYAVFMTVKVENLNPDGQMTLNWVKKTEPKSSSIFIIDPQNSQYHYPVEADLYGDVVHGHARYGMIAFEPLRGETDRLELYLSDAVVAKSPQRKVKTTFEYRRANLLEITRHLDQMPKFMDRVEEMLALVLDDTKRELTENVNNALARVSPSSSHPMASGGPVAKQQGCSCLVVLIIMVIVGALITSTQLPI